MIICVADSRIRSVISFNRGGTWRQLDKPVNVDCDEQVQNVRYKYQHETINGYLLKDTIRVYVFSFLLTVQPSYPRRAQSQQPNRVHAGSV